jgi:hypothetical protein
VFYALDSRVRQAMRSRLLNIGTAAQPRARASLPAEAIRSTCPRLTWATSSWRTTGVPDRRMAQWRVPGHDDTRPLTPYTKTRATKGLDEGNARMGPSVELCQ